MTEQRDVLVIGGGLGGLSAAWRSLDSPNLRLTLLEASGRLGGLVRSEEYDGFHLEVGPDIFLSSKPGIMDLVAELGLTDELLCIRPEFRRSFLYQGGRFHAVPSGFYLISSPDVLQIMRLPFMSFRGRCRMLAEWVIPRRQIQRDESVGSFVRRRFGEEALTRIAQPMIGGIYSADPEKLSLKATLPVFLEMERESGSVSMGLLHRRRKMAAAGGASGPRYGLFRSFRGGMGVLPRTLYEKIRDRAEVCLNSPVTALDKEAQGWCARTADGREFHAGQVILALPPHAAAELLDGSVSGAAGILRKIQCESAWTINVAYDADAWPRPLEGAGAVIPHAEGRIMIGCTFVQNKFEGRVPPGKILFRAFVGGAFSEPWKNLEENELTGLVAGEMKEIFGLRKAPLWIRASRHEKAMPQYHVGHLERIQKLFDRVRTEPGLYLTGNAYHGAGIPVTILHASRTAIEAAGARESQTAGRKLCR